MRRSALFLSLLLTSITGVARAGDACALAEPPAEAGEMFTTVGSTKIEARIYPRLSDLSSNYTGCQVLWATINGKKSKTVVHLKDGRVMSTDPGPDVPLCKSGERTGDTGCYPRKWALQASFPAGCTAKRTEGKHTKECAESFEQEHRILDGIVD